MLVVFGDYHFGDLLVELLVSCCRVIDRRPKDVWAVRFAVGAYLIDRKYFEPLELT